MPQASPDTPVFVMVHGIGLSHRYFDRLQADLIRHGHTQVLDLPGFGGTPKPGQQLAIEDYAVVIGEALDAAGIRSCVLIGHSMGAQFVTELALRRPDLVSELVLIGPVTDSARRSVIWHTLALGLDSLLERPLTNAMVFTDYARCGLPWYFTELPVMLNYRLHERLPLATQPVLIIRGSNDPVARHRWCSRLAATAQDGRLVEVSGQPHAAHRGGAREVSEAILALLHKDNRLPPQPGNSPVAARQEPRTILRRLRTVVSGRNSATPRPDTANFRSITIGDRQCRAYPMMHTGAHESDVSPGEATAQRVFVLIHGIGMSHRYFKRLASVLADYGDTYLIDLPGYGWTATPAEEMSNPANADLIGTLLDDIGVDSCTVVGHSMGVQSATELAITRPDLVSNLVLIGAAVDAKRRTALQQALRQRVFVLIHGIGMSHRYFARLAAVLADHGDTYLIDLPGYGWTATPAEEMSNPANADLIGTLLDDIGVDSCTVVGHSMGVQQRVFVLIHGIGMSHRYFARLAAVLADHGDTYLIDLPGYGWTATPAEEMSNPANADLIGTLLDDIGVDSCTVVGHSMGVQSATELAITRPDLVSNLVLIQRVFVLIHGIGMSHRYFARLAAVLADHGDTYLIDLPGYGWTGTPAEEMSNPANADLIGALLDEIGVGSCTVVGHSMGVQSATELAITRPDLVSHLVLIGAAVDAKRRTAYQQALRLGMNSLLEKPLLNAVQFLDVLRCGPRWYLAELAVALAYYLEERLPLVGQRVLIMRGSRDLIAGNHWSRTLAETSQRGELLEIPRKPHAVHHSDPATVAAGILAFTAHETTHQWLSPEPELTLR